MNDALVGIRRVDVPHVVEPDRATAIARALKEAREGDIVILAGKGHETYQVLKDKTIPFDDRAVAQRSAQGLWVSPGRVSHDPELQEVARAMRAAGNPPPAVSGRLERGYPDTETRAMCTSRCAGRNTTGTTSCRRRWRKARCAVVVERWRPPAGKLRACPTLVVPDGARAPCRTWGPGRAGNGAGRWWR